MERYAIVFGLVLCGLTVLGLLLSPFKTPAVFVPVLFGIPALLCGVVSLNPHRRRVGMALAAGIAALGATVGGLELTFLLFGFLSGEGVDQLAFGIVLSMCGVCLAFVLTWAVVGWPYRRGRRRLSGSKAGGSKTGGAQSGGVADGGSGAD